MFILKFTADDPVFTSIVCVDKWRFILTHAHNSQIVPIFRHL